MDKPRHTGLLEFTEEQQERLADSTAILADALRRPLRITTGSTDGRGWACIALADGAREGPRTLVILGFSGDPADPFEVRGPDGRPVTIPDPAGGRGRVALTGGSIEAMRAAEFRQALERDAKGRDRLLRVEARRELARLDKSPDPPREPFVAARYALELATRRAFWQLQSAIGRERMMKPRPSPSQAAEPAVSRVAPVGIGGPRHLIDPKGFNWRTFNGPELARLEDAEFFMRAAWELSEGATLIVVAPGLRHERELAALNGDRVRWLPIGPRVIARLRRKPGESVAELLRIARAELWSAGWRLTAPSG